MKQGGARYTYAYDADGLRIAQTEHPAMGAPTTTHYVQDGSHAYSHVIESRVEQGGVTALQAVHNFADGLLSQTRYASGVPNTRFVHQDGFGSTRFLTDGAATRTDAWSYDAFGNEIAREGSTPAEHLYRGEQLDPNLGFYYLRARYYDASSGRFPTMDRWTGASNQPETLHKYAYGSADPVNLVDPSGFMSMAETTATLRLQMTLTLSRVSTVAVNTGRIAANDALWSVSLGAMSAARAAGLGILTALALTADSQKRDRLAGTPMIVFGREFGEHAQHIRDAQQAEGSNFFAAPFALNRTSRWSRGWLRYTSECNPEARLRKGGNKACDEYPFASSRQGGPVNYVFGSVSLRLIDKGESDDTRDFIRDFYNMSVPGRDGFSKESRFIALGIPGIRSFFTDRAGNVHYWQEEP